MLLLIGSENSLPELEKKELKKYLEWLLSYREDVEYWNCIISIGRLARDLVRKEGIHKNIAGSFEQSISNIKMGFCEQQFADELKIFLKEQSKGIKSKECFIGSSEVLESLFGKIKHMEYEQTAFGFTSLVLAAIAHVGSSDDKLIQQAITTIKLSDIEGWSAKEIGESIQTQRRQAKRTIVNLKKKMEQEYAGLLEKKVMGF